MADGSNELTLSLERVLPAPRTRVFEALVNRDELAKWWGPKRFTSPAIDMDVRVGGSYRIAMQPPEGELFYLSGDSSRSTRPGAWHTRFGGRIRRRPIGRRW